MMERWSAAAWEREFDRWLAPFWAALGHKKRRDWASVYVRGLLGPGERKSVEPLAARVAPGDAEQLHHFVCTSGWETAPLERVLAEQTDRLVGGPDAVLIVDDTTLPKQGTHSVGVARQYCGQVGKTANCQTLVSLTLARAEVPVCVGLRLFLPAEWTDDPARCRRAGVPEGRLGFRSKPALALEELDRLLAVGMRFGAVVADALYGRSLAFRRGLSARALRWAVGVLGTQRVYPAGVRVRAPRRGTRGRPSVHPVPTRQAEPAKAVLACARWRRLTWREGTKGPLRARFAAVRVRVADGPKGARGRRLPGEAVWLVGEERASGERRDYLTNHPAQAWLRTLARAIKARWSSRTSPPAAEGGTGARSLRGALVGWAAPPRAADADQLRLPPAPAAHSSAQAGGKGPRGAPARRPSRRCRPSGAPCSPGSPPSNSAVPNATGS